jgi:hypothetical protein
MYHVPGRRAPWRVLPNEKTPDHLAAAETPSPSMTCLQRNGGWPSPKAEFTVKPQCDETLQPAKPRKYTVATAIQLGSDEAGILARQNRMPKRGVPKPGAPKSDLLETCKTTYASLANLKLGHDKSAPGSFHQNVLLLVVQSIEGAGMASSTPAVPRELWERHKETILGLRYGEKLPLEDTKTHDRSVMQVMRDEHHFHAT